MIKLILEQFQANPLMPTIVRNEAYEGWVSNFHGAKLAGKPVSWDLSNPKYRFGLYCLASAWSRSSRWEGPVRLVLAMASKADQYLDSTWWRSGCTKNDWQDILARCSLVEIPEGRPSTPRIDCIKSFEVISANFDKIEAIVTSLDSGRITPRQAYNDMRKIRGTGFGTRAWRIKIPLIFRELRCQGWSGIPGSCCCVPDVRVIRTYATTGINLPTDVLDASQQIYADFQELYDIPPFLYRPVRGSLSSNAKISFGPNHIIAASLDDPDVAEDDDFPFEYISIAKRFGQSIGVGIDGDDLCQRVINRIKNLFIDADTISVPLLNAQKTFIATLRETGVEVDNLGGQRLLPWCAFCTAVQIINYLGGQAPKGAAVGPKQTHYLGSSKLPLKSIEGAVAFVCYGRLPGSSVFRRITPLAALLDMAGIAVNRHGRPMQLQPQWKTHQ